MVTRKIELTEEQAQELERAASSEGRSISELIRARLGTPSRTQPVDREELKHRAIAAIGRFHSDETDLSAEHDRYLDEAFGD